MINDLKREGCGVLFDDVMIPGLWYADDIAALASDPDSTAHCLRVIDHWCCTHRMVVNARKSGILLTGPRQAAQELSATPLPQVSCNNIPLVQGYTYLGVLFTSAWTFTAHADRLTQKLTHESTKLAYITGGT